MFVLSPLQWSKAADTLLGASCVCCWLQIRAGKWWIDESNGYARNNWDEKHYHQPARMTIDAIKRDFAAAGLAVKSVAADAQQAEAVAPDAVAQDSMQVTP